MNKGNIFRCIRKIAKNEYKFGHVCQSVGLKIELQWVKDTNGKILTVEGL